MDIGSGWEAVLWLFIFLLSLFPLVLGVAAKLTGLVVYKFVLGRMQQQGNGAVVSGTTGKDLLQYVGIWVGLNILLSLFPLMGYRHSVNSISSFLLVCLLLGLQSLTFWYYRSDYGYFELKPMKKLLLQVVVFLLVSLVFRYLVLPELLAYLLLAWYFVKINRRSAEAFRAGV